MGATDSPDDVVQSMFDLTSMPQLVVPGLVIRLERSQKETLLKI